MVTGAAGGGGATCVTGASGASPAVAQLPWGKEDSFQGVIDLVEMKGASYKDETLGADFELEEIPEAYADRAHEMREKLVEAVAETDDQKQDPHQGVSGTQTFDEILESLHRGLHRGLDGAIRLLELNIGRPSQEPGQGSGRIREELGGELDGEQHPHSHQVEEVVHRGAGEGFLELAAATQIAEGSQRVGHRRADIGAHDHRHGEGDGERPGADQSDYFNYGFDEFTWEMYRQRQQTMSTKLAAQKTETAQFQHMFGVNMNASPTGPGTASTDN